MAEKPKARPFPVVCVPRAAMTEAVWARPFSELRQRASRGDLGMTALVINEGSERHVYNSCDYGVTRDDGLVMQAEILRRRSLTSALADLFRQRPNVWIPWPELADVGGALAWRTRVSNARKVLGGSIDWNQSIEASAYRWVPAVEHFMSEYQTQPELF